MRRPAALGTAPASAAVLALATATVLALAAAAPRAPTHPEGAPPAHTGGFGEPTCISCHFGHELAEPGATLRLEGVPDAYTPGERYTLHVVLAMDGLPRGGFQLTARFADGELAGQQAGTLHPADDRAIAVDFDAVTYASHSYDGTYPTTPDTLRWPLHWTAPETASADIVFHLVANAADDDESPFGDRIYGGVWALGVGR